MSSKRLHLIFVAVIGLLFLSLIVGTYQANKLLAAKGKTLTSLKAKSQALTEEQANLAKAKQDITKYTELYNITKSIVPEDKSQAEAVREIVNLADANNISLGSITFPASTLGGAASNSANTTAPTSSATNTSSAANSLSQMKPVKGIPGVYELPITVQSNSDEPTRYSQLSGFLAALEKNRRTAQVNSIVIQPNEDNPNFLDFTLIINEYIKP
jgi:Tfp pilus assembly protein PilO